VEPEGKGALPFPMSLFRDPQGLVGLFSYFGVWIISFSVSFLLFIPMNDEYVIN
jgi:hypothetical protein